MIRRATFAVLVTSLQWGCSLEPVGEQQSLDFVLVHGAWHGGWAWEPIVSRLESEGHKVWAPTLPGMDGQSEQDESEKSQISLDDHVSSLATLLEHEELRDVILVGHSYGGMVLAGALGNDSSRVKKVVFLDALVPENGDSLQSFVGVSGDDWQALAEQGRNIPPPAEDDWTERWGIPEELIESVRSKITSQPPRTFLDPVSWNGPEMIEPDHFFIRCVENPNPAFDLSTQRVRSIDSWEYFELETHHDAMLIVPDELTDMLLQIARSP